MKIITPGELKKSLDRNEVFLVDVREPNEFNSQRIAGASLVPLNVLTAQHLPPTHQPIILYCRSGKRSLAACAKLLAQDPFLDVSSLAGGILAWHEAGYCVQE
jgi:rhodanese-related sulfurtransferase